MRLTLKLLTSNSRKAHVIKRILKNSGILSFTATKKKGLVSLIRSPHVNKNSQEQFWQRTISIIARLPVFLPKEGSVFQDELYRQLSQTPEIYGRVTKKQKVIFQTHF